MAYDKPKVTIDLEEYEDLKNKIKELDERLKGGDNILWQKACYYLMKEMTPESFRRAQDFLSVENISFATTGKFHLSTTPWLEIWISPNE
jgi:hypothetical protein